MSLFKKNNYLIIPILTGVFDFIWFYFIIYFAHKNNLLFSINEVTWNTITTKFLIDFLAMLFIPSIIIIACKKQLSDFQLCMNSKYEIMALLGVMTILFILHNEFGILGLYRFFFYLVVIAFGEEFIYRGFIYNKIKSNSKYLAIIISGTLWGIMHSILPSIVSNANLPQFILSICSEIGGGILIGWYYIYLLEKSKSLWIPTLVHAIIDYSVSYIGTIVAIIIFFYFLKKSRTEKYNS
ncbi:CPBP family intramembrane glutamic endopeptidase [Anaeromicropila herbilytica]|uniref:CAAX prenyl protease 2/Lysostaphin resistance protein A-like domain-containing protein n=1 Tax=Anaeromicropila herbilytica TaxID=2785025 RepID=A0A7R7ID08_9FIRM|nr:CPBP family intramembrane glutamic endopeptidase [Anaeromicropila herbilytica]BCN30411.1 hypothetical protein bsdtb5_17060 [Anaeromicropila herbilytica]